MGHDEAKETKEAKDTKETNVILRLLGGSPPAHIYNTADNSKPNKTTLEIKKYIQGIKMILKTNT